MSDFTKDVKVNLAEAARVKEFVNITSRYDCDFDLISGHYVIDGKSIMGIFSLNLSRPIQLRIHAKTEQQQEKILKALKGFFA